MGCFDHRQYVELTIHFKCNLRCEHCMIEGTMDWLTPKSREDLDKLFRMNSTQRLWKGLILTGSEVTLRKDLPQLARDARQHGFEHVRIQTHGMRLANRDYCEELIEAGIDEFFVSLTAADAHTHDRITKVKGSFERTLQGLENLDTFPGVKTITNTVITQHSYRQLAQVIDLVGPLKRLVQFDFWNYWPMKEQDDKNLVVSHEEIFPYLETAISKAVAMGKAIEIKNFPECLMGKLGVHLNNDQPKLFIDERFWPEFMRNGFNQCVFRDQCQSSKCLGLNTAYIEKFGWMENVLHPILAHTPKIDVSEKVATPDYPPTG